MDTAERVGLAVSAVLWVAVASTVAYRAGYKQGEIDGRKTGILRLAIPSTDGPESAKQIGDTAATRSTAGVAAFAVVDPNGVYSANTVGDYTVLRTDRNGLLLAKCVP